MERIQVAIKSQKIIGTDFENSRLFESIVEKLSKTRGSANLLTRISLLRRRTEADRECFGP